MKLPNSGNVVKFLNDNMKEAFLLKELRHEHIIGFEDAFISNENEMSLEFNIVTELAEGGTLYT